MFQRARRNRSKKNIKLTLGIRDGQEFVIYSIFPPKASKRKRNRQRKPRKAPTPPCEEVVEQREGPSEPIPLSESTFSPMKTRQNKRKRQESNNRTPEQGRFPQVVRTSTTSVPSPVPLQYSVPTENRYSNLRDLLDGESGSESDQEINDDDKLSDGAISTGSSRDTIASNSSRATPSKTDECYCFDGCRNYLREINETSFPTGCAVCCCRCSCLTLYKAKDERAGSDSRHSCKLCSYFLIKNNKKKNKRTYSEVTKSVIAQ